MTLTDVAPAGWDNRIAFPLQSAGFAEASRALGYRPFFAEAPAGQALVLVRRVPIPLLSGWTARAKVYAHSADANFLPALAARLRRLGVSHVKFGDSQWGLSGATPQAVSGFRRVPYHRVILDLTKSEAELLAATKRMIRRHVRKHAVDGVTVTEVRDAADLRDYVSLTVETGERMRERDVAAVFPPAYFETILHEMVPRRQAVLFIVRAGDVPLAAGAFVITADRLAQIHGASTRDRELTPKQGPTAMFWGAMRFARAQGCRIFDMGAVTPTEDPTHPHFSVYEYKKLWGGQLEDFEGAEVIVSPWKYRFQERVLAPMWDRAHPLYLRVFGQEHPHAADQALAPSPVPGGLWIGTQEQTR